MNKLILTAALALMASVAGAQTVSIGNVQLGSGTPGEQGKEPAVPWESNISHAAQYLPGYPTAAVIFPRVVEVKCDSVDGKLINCDGYTWTPNMGRAEYLMIKPVARPVPQVQVKEVVKEVPKEVIVYKEVPAKKGKE
jgi:hypothetical protein